MTRVSVFSVVALAAAFASAGCGADRAGQPAARAESGGKQCPSAWRAGWQQLADRVDARVYCPTWLPSPLTGEIGGPLSGSSVSSDRSYLVSFLYQREGQEIHVNLRGYPGRTAIPRCRTVEIVGGKRREGKTPCFSDPRGQRKVGSLDVTVYTVGRDADQWHVTYIWRRAGTLYTIGEHVAPPFTSATRVMQNLDRIVRTFAVVEPSS